MKYLAAVAPLFLSGCAMLGDHGPRGPFREPCTMSGVRIELLSSERIGVACDTALLGTTVEDAPLVMGKGDTTLGCAMQIGPLDGAPTIYIIDDAGVIAHEMRHLFSWLCRPQDRPVVARK